MNLATDKKIYFLSDFHLGAPDHARSLERERIIVQFLEKAGEDAQAIFLMGDMFDFWYEYRRVVPKGFLRLLGKLAELRDKGVQLWFFPGNHDMWVKNYFVEELDMEIYHHPAAFEWNGKKFWLAHGDGLGPGDHGYKRLKKIFRNPLAKWLFGIFPPALGMGLAHYLSRRSRAQTGAKEEVYLGDEKEWLVIYCKEVMAKQPVDFFVFGHRHLPIDLQFGNGSRYINLGDWISYFTYAVFDGTDIALKSFTGRDDKIIRKQGA